MTTVDTVTQTNPEQLHSLLGSIRNVLARLEEHADVEAKTLITYTLSLVDGILGELTVPEDAVALPPYLIGINGCVAQVFFDTTPPQFVGVVRITREADGAVRWDSYLAPKAGSVPVDEIARLLREHNSM